MPTATNPETGEKAVLINNQWVPYTHSASGQDGTKAYLINNNWVMEDGKPPAPPQERVGFTEKMGQLGAEAIADNAFVRGRAEAGTNRVEAMQRAYDEATKRGHVAASAPYNMPLPSLKAEIDKLRPEAKAALNEYKNIRKEIAADRERTTTGNAYSDAVAGILGLVGGGAADPINLLSPMGGAGKVVASPFMRGVETFARGAAVNAPIAAGQNLVNQEQDVRLGIKDKISGEETLYSTLIAAGLGGLVNSAVHAKAKVAAGVAPTPQETMDAKILAAAREQALKENRPINPADLERAKAMFTQGMTPEMRQQMQDAAYGKQQEQFTQQQLEEQMRQSQAQQVIDRQAPAVADEARPMGGVTPEDRQAAADAAYRQQQEAFTRQQIEAEGRQSTAEQVTARHTAMENEPVGMTPEMRQQMQDAAYARQQEQFNAQQLAEQMRQSEARQATVRQGNEQGLGAAQYIDLMNSSPKVPGTDVLSDALMRDRFHNPVPATTDPIPGVTEYPKSAAVLLKEAADAKAAEVAAAREARRATLPEKPVYTIGPDGKPMLKNQPISNMVDTNTPEFKAFIEGSVAKNPDGTPQVYYHGTRDDVTEFKPGQANAIFLTPSHRFADDFATNVFPSPHRPQKGAPNIVPVFVRALNPFDYHNTAHVDAVLAKMGKRVGDREYGKLRHELDQGYWTELERADVQAAIKALGHDGFFVKEAGKKNLAVYSSNQIKSAIGNKGTFDINSPVITNALAHPLEDVNPDLGKALIKGNAREALEAIANKSGNSYFRELANRLLSDPMFKPLAAAVHSLGKTVVGHPIFGEWNGNTGIMKLAMDTGSHMSESTALHEFQHAKLNATMFRFLTDPKSLPAATRETAKRLMSLYDYVKANVADKEAYGFKDVYEFLAEGTTNKAFQQVLKDTRLSKEFAEKGGFIRNAYDAFANLINKLLGIDPNSKNMNALQAMNNEVADLYTQLELRPEVKRAMSDPVNIRSRMEAGDYGPENKSWAQRIASKLTKDPASEPMPYAKFVNENLTSMTADDKRRFGKALYDSYKEDFIAKNSVRKPPVGYFTPTIDKLKSEYLYRPDGSKRFEDTGIFQHLINYLKPGYHQANTNPIVRAMHDFIDLASVAKDNAYQEITAGIKIEPKAYPLVGNIGVTNIRKAMRKLDPTSYVAVAKKLSGDVEGIKDFFDIVNSYKSDMKTLRDSEFLLKAGYSKHAVEMVQAVLKMGEKALEYVNKGMKARGLEEINARDDWFATQSRIGPYQAMAKDPTTGKHTFLAGFDNMTDARKVAEAVSKKTGMEVVAIEAKHNSSVSLQPTSDITNLYKNLSGPARDAISAALDEAFSTFGIKKFEKARDSTAEGYAGSKLLVEALGPKAAFDHFNSTLDAYAHTAASFYSNSDVQKFSLDLMKEPKLIADFPNSTDAAKSLYDFYSGVNTGLDNLTDTVSKSLSNAINSTLGTRFTDKIAESTARKSAAYFLRSAVTMLNPGYLLGNLTQFGYMPSRLAQINAESLGGKGNVPVSVGKAFVRMFNPFDPDTNKLFKRMVESGAAEPKFIEQFTQGLKTDSDVEKVLKYLTLERAGQQTEQFTRAMSYLMTYEFGKSAGLDDAKAHSMAVRETRGAMINYDGLGRSPALLATGRVAATTLGSLMTFVTNMGFSLSSYLSSAAFKASPDSYRTALPALYFFAFLGATAGIRGMPGFDNINDIVTWINETQLIPRNKPPIPTPVELLAKSGMPQALEYGLPSAATGTKLSGSLGLGDMLGNKGSPLGFKALWTLKETVGTMLDSFYFDNMTKAEIQQALNAVSPPMLDQYMIKEYQGGTVKNKEGATIYNRTPAESNMSIAMGKPPIAEAEARERKYMSSSEKAARDALKSQAIKLFVDGLEDGKLNKFAIETMVNNPEMLKGFKGKLEHEMLNRALDSDTRMLLDALKGADLHQAQRILELLSQRAKN